MARTLQGKFRPKNPDKYKGNAGNICYRSSWELDFMQYCDTTSAIIWWMSEERCVWYTNPIDKKKHRYFPDFIVCYNRSDGVEVTEMVEIKPQKHVDGPNPNPKRRTKSWVNEVKTYLINQKKWEAATNLCESNGWNFRLLTEKNVRNWSGSPFGASTKRSKPRAQRDAG